MLFRIAQSLKDNVKRLAYLCSIFGQRGATSLWRFVAERWSLCGDSSC